MLGLFGKKDAARTDPVCGMKEEKGKGEVKGGNWFCSAECARKYEKKAGKQKKGHCC